jgi:hypothetical protein
MYYLFVKKIINKTFKKMKKMFFLFTILFCIVNTCFAFSGGWEESQGDAFLFDLFLVIVVGTIFFIFLSKRPQLNSLSTSEQEKEKNEQTTTIDRPILLVINNFHERIRDTLLGGARNVGYEVVVCPRPEEILRLTPEQQHRVISILLSLTFVSDGKKETQQGLFRGWDFYQELLLNEEYKSIPVFIIHSEVLLDDVSHLRTSLRPCDSFILEGSASPEWFVKQLFKICKPQPNMFGEIIYIPE